MPVNCSERKAQNQIQWYFPFNRKQTKLISAQKIVHLFACIHVNILLDSRKDLMNSLGSVPSSPADKVSLSHKMQQLNSRETNQFAQ